MKQRYQQSDTYPPCSIEIYFSGEKYPDDYAGLSEHLPGADVFIPELPGWSTYMRETLEIISIEGVDSEAAAEIKDTPIELFAKELGGTAVTIAFIETSADEELDSLIRQTYEKAFTNREKYLRLSSFVDAVREFDQALSEWALVGMKVRDAYMIDRLEECIVHLYGERREHIDVLLQLGDSHTSVYHILKKKGVQISRSFSTKPYVYSNTSQAVREKIFQKKSEPTTIVKAFFEVHLLPELDIELGAHDQVEENVRLREISDPLNVRDINKYFWEVRKRYMRY